MSPLRFLAYWFAASIVTGMAWAFVLGLGREMRQWEDERPENDDQVRERMERMRDGGSEVWR